MKTQPLLVVECTNWEIIYTTLLFEENIDLKDVKKTILSLPRKNAIQSLYMVKNSFFIVLLLLGPDRLGCLLHCCLQSMVIGRFFWSAGRMWIHVRAM